MFKTFACRAAMVGMGLLLFATTAVSAIRDPNLQITVDTRFIQLNDNFFESIGVSFREEPGLDWHSIQTINSDPQSGIDLPISETQSALIEQSASTVPNFGGFEGGGASNFGFAILSDVEAFFLLEAGAISRSGLTLPPNTGGNVEAQSAMGFEVFVPEGHQGPVVFETEARFSADIVPPQSGAYGLFAQVELVPDLDAFRFLGPEQRFDWSSNSLGPFGSLFSTIDDFSLTKEGVVLFRGENTIQHEIDPAEIQDNTLYYNVASAIHMGNSGATLAQIDAFNTVSYTLRSLTPGVTFRPAFPLQAAPILGDYNGNGVVDAPDYNVWRDTFLSVDDLRADGNGNGIIDAPDYNAWRDNFGATAVSVPEPTTLLLLAMATLAALARPQRPAL